MFYYFCSCHFKDKTSSVALFFLVTAFIVLPKFFYGREQVKKIANRSLLLY